MARRNEAVANMDPQLRKFIILTPPADSKKSSNLNTITNIPAHYMVTYEEGPVH